MAMDTSRRSWRVVVGSLLGAGVLFASQFATGADTAAPAGGPQQAGALSYEQDIAPLIQKYCYQCHGNGKAKAELALDSYKTLADVQHARDKWEQVLHTVRKSEMPPEEAKAMPTQAERELITNWIEKELFKFDPNNPDPGRVTIRRLNRAEYSNTIRDLVGVEFHAAADFPPDDSGYGFDNIGDVLSLPPVLMEKYLAAAEKVLDEAIPTEPVQSQVRRTPASLAQIGFNAVGDRGDGWVQLISLEDDDVAVELPTTAGEYIVRVMAFCQPTGGNLVGGGSSRSVNLEGPPPPSKISIMLNNAFIQDFELSTDEANPGVYEARVGVPAGKNRFRAVMGRLRGGAYETVMVNGRIGKQQPGIGFVKYIEVEGPLPAATRRFPAASLEATGQNKTLPKGGRKLESNGEVTLKVNAEHDGEYVLRAQAYADQAGNEPVKMEFRIDGQPLKTFDVIAPARLQPLPRQRLFSISLLQELPYVYEFRTRLTKGEHKFSAAFINDLNDPQAENLNLRDRNLYIDHLEVSDLSAPAIQPEMPQEMKSLFATQVTSENKTEVARDILRKFARRAWRRPVQDEELDRLAQLFALAQRNDETFESSIKLAMKAVLISPHFLFRGEIVPDPNDPKTVHPVSELALASRLSYFIWSSLPDEELLSLAERGELRQNLQAQVKRMLASPKAKAMTDNFASQWLQTRSLPTFTPDKEMFPNYDLQLAAAMQTETEMFFDHIMREDRNVTEFLTGSYTFINERLAKHYGIEGVSGEEFRKVTLEGTKRRGVLTQGSILVLTSNPTRTSPVKRGKWVLDNLLGTPPPPAPPDVPELEKEGKKLTGSLRQQMEQHRADPNCASCHARMDPIGFGLENFDAVGVWRDKEGDSEINATGELVSGETFAGAVDLTEILAKSKEDEFLRCIAEKMLTYALGRGIEYYDRPAIDKIAAQLKAGDYKFSQLVSGVVDSLPFQMTRGEGNQTASR